MKEEDLKREAEAALKEVEEDKAHRVHDLDSESSEKARSNPFSYLIALVLLLLIIMMVVPYYGIKVNPEPENIPSVEAVIPHGIDALAAEYPGLRGNERVNYARLMIPRHQAIRNLAAMIVTSSCSESEVCYSKALFYFVRDQFKYVGDPPDDYLESPFDTLKTGGADCDGMAILLANLQAAVGIPVRFAFIPGHVYVQVKIDSAPNKYKDEDKWISLDPTCNDCEFGEVPYTTVNKQKEIFYPQ